MYNPKILEYLIINAKDLYLSKDKLLSMFKINSDMKSFDEGEYDICDSVIFKAVTKQGKGGCVKIFKECARDLMTLAFSKEI